MPQGDRTGPLGKGPKTGRGMGFCAGYSSSGVGVGIPQGGLGNGIGRGRRIGRGFR